MAMDSSSGWSSALSGGADTIVARSSAAGRAGLAIIRVSGGGARKLAGAVCPDLEFEHGWRASLVELVGADGAAIDRAVVLPYPAPRSYTGEDMFELTVHGSPWIVRTTIEALIAAGGRQAEPGEFTRRAVANGKLDLVQAEAVNELTAAETAAQARMAQAQVSGSLSREFSELKTDLTELLATLEASLDFSHHEIPYDRHAAETGQDRCAGQIRSLMTTAAAGRRVREGVRVAIVGPANSGKSTLFNALVGAERAIVSPHAGTTRDLVEAELEMGGVRVVLQDTAGLEAATDPIEIEGIRRARGAAAAADAVIVLWPADRADGPRIEPVEGQPVIRLRSKFDVDPTAEVPAGWTAVSSRTDLGMDELRHALGDAVTAEVADLGGQVAISERHRAALETALAELESGDFDQPEVAAEAVRASLDAVRGILGEVVTEDVLDLVFAGFCIGK
jgi:tRNA modification GTPase